MIYRLPTLLATALLIGGANAQMITTEHDFPVGTWKVTFANKVVEVCKIDESGSASVKEPRRESSGTTLLRNGSFLITFTDKRVERWTPVGERFVVEHWPSGHQFTSENPVMGIAEKRHLHKHRTLKPSAK